MGDEKTNYIGNLAPSKGGVPKQTSPPGEANNLGGENEDVS